MNAHERQDGFSVPEYDHLDPRANAKALLQSLRVTGREHVAGLLSLWQSQYAIHNSQLKTITQAMIALQSEELIISDRQLEEAVLLIDGIRKDREKLYDPFDAEGSIERLLVQLKSLKGDRLKLHVAQRFGIHVDMEYLRMIMKRLYRIGNEDRSQDLLNDDQWNDLFEILDELFINHQNRERHVLETYCDLNPHASVMSFLWELRDQTTPESVEACVRSWCPHVDYNQLGKISSCCLREEEWDNQNPTKRRISPAQWKQFNKALAKLGDERREGATS